MTSSVSHTAGGRRHVVARAAPSLADRLEPAQRCSCSAPTVSSRRSATPPDRHQRGRDCAAVIPGYPDLDWRNAGRGLGRPNAASPGSLRTSIRPSSPRGHYPATARWWPHCDATGRSPVSPANRTQRCTAKPSTVQRPATARRTGSAATPTPKSRPAGCRRPVRAHQRHRPGRADRGGARPTTGYLSRDLGPARVIRDPTSTRPGPLPLPRLARANEARWSLLLYYRLDAAGISHGRAAGSVAWLGAW